MAAQGVAQILSGRAGHAMGGGVGSGAGFSGLGTRAGGVQPRLLVEDARGLGGAALRRPAFGGFRGGWTGGFLWSWQDSFSSFRSFLHVVPLHPRHGAQALALGAQSQGDNGGQEFAVFADAHFRKGVEDGVEDFALMIEITGGGRRLQACGKVQQGLAENERIAVRSRRIHGRSIGNNSFKVNIIS